MTKPLQVVAVVVVLLTTLAGTAGAASAAGPQVTDRSEALAADGPLAQVAGDGGLASGVTYWSGARLQFDASRIVPEGAGEDGRTFELWRVTADGRLNQRVRTFTVGSDGTYELRTGDLAGRFAIRYGEQVVYVLDGVGYLESPPDGSEVTVDSAAFEFGRQSLDVSWSDPSVYPGQEVTLALSSNRNDFSVAVSGANLTYEDLTAVFPESAYAENHDARADESVLVLRAGATTSYRLDTAPIEPGERSFEFDVVDTAATKTARLSVQQPADGGGFVSVERRENVGDVVEANLSCTHCFLVVGGPGQGLLDVVEIQDSDGNGYVDLRINTRYAGMYGGASGYPSGIEAYTSPEDSVSRYSLDSVLKSVQDELNYNVVTLSSLREQQGLDPKGRSRPLQAGSITLTLTKSDFLIDRSAYGSGPPLGGKLVVRDETDVRTLTLEPRRLSGVETLAAPGGPRLPANAEALHGSVGPRESVALGDHLVFRFDVSGVFGYFQATGLTVETVQDNREEGIHLTLEELPGSGGGSTIAHHLDQTALQVYAHPTTDSLYVAVQTGGTSRTNLQEGRYRATLTLDGVDGKHDDYSTADAFDGYPYLPPGRSESVSGTATLEPPTASIEAPAEGAEPHLNADGSLVVTGTTSLAPGGTLRLEVTATDYAWETSTTARVNETGHWTGTLPLQEAPGEEFTVSVSLGDTRFDERTYTVQPPVENASDGGGSSGGDGGSGGGGGPVGGDDGGILSSLPGLGGLAVPIGAGAGLIVVLWAAWKLVIRRMLV